MKKIYLAMAAFLCLLIANAQEEPFITTWYVDTIIGLQITIPTTGTGYNYTIDFGDGNVQTNVTGNVSHTYSATGTYTVTISGDFPRINFGNSLLDNREKISSIEQWGDTQWTSMNSAFLGCINLSMNAQDLPDLSQLTDLSLMFSGAYYINSTISDWNISNVTNLQSMFKNAYYFNQPLNNWDVSNITNMSGMFYGASSFNQPLDNWDTSNVTTMTSMFSGALSFNQPLANWNVSNVTNMYNMFHNALAFNQAINSWDVSNVTLMNGMLANMVL